MTIASELNELQKIDLMILNNQELLERIIFQINDTSSIDDCKSKLIAIESALKKLILQRRSTELLETELNDRIKSLDKRFVSVRNNKEFTAVQEELNNTKMQLSNCEDELLGILEKLDKFESAKDTFSNRLPKLEDYHSTLSKELKTKQLQSEQNLEELNLSRKQMENKFPVNILKLYEKIFSHTKSKAIAIFDNAQNICGECRVSQPQHVVQKLNKEDEIIQCNSCKLILYKP